MDSAAVETRDLVTDPATRRLAILTQAVYEGLQEALVEGLAAGQDEGISASEFVSAALTATSLLFQNQAINILKASDGEGFEMNRASLVQALGQITAVVMAVPSPNRVQLASGVLPEFR